MNSDRLIATSWTAVSDRFTPTPVPFQLQPSREGFLETRETTARLSCMFMIAPALGALSTITLAVTGQWAAAIGIGIVELFVVAFFFRLWWSSRNRRGLVFDRPARQWVILDSRGKRRPNEEARSDQCAFLIHQVRLGIYHSRSGRPTVFWDGYAAVAHVGASRFVLACDKKVEVLREYSRTLPDWMPVLNEGDGPLIEASAHRRIL